MRYDLLLLDGDQRSTLAACRSLGKRGLKVAVYGSGPAQSSKYCAEKLFGPNPQAEPKEFKVWLIEELRKSKPKVLLPMTDYSLGLVAEDERIKGEVNLPFPALEQLTKVQQKEELLSLATALDMAVPRWMLINNEQDCSSWETFPAVIKSARAAHVGDKPLVRYVSSKSELHEASRSYPAPYLIQEQIFGAGVGVFILAVDGKVKASFAHKRLLDKPPSGGVSVLCESISLTEAPIKEATKLVEALKWNGILMVEFKVKASTPYLMEINPRFWGSLQLSISSGVDFPWLLWLFANSQKIEMSPEQYKIGQRLRWDLGTLDHLFIRIKNEGFSSLLKIIYRNELLLFQRISVAHETFSIEDPKPFWIELSREFKQLWIS